MSTASRAARAALVLLVAGCITDPVTGKSVIGKNVSTLEEEQLGFSERPAIVQQFSGAYPDAELQSYLATVVLGMAHGSVRPNLAWTFTVLNSSVPNAFAMPGGEVFITRGLLWRLDDEAEFAVVMGHEVGHVEHKHSLQSMGRDPYVMLGGQLLGKALGNENAGTTAAGLGVAGFTRDQEREADVQGVRNAYHAGYDPRRGAEVFKKLLALQAGGEKALDAWTSDHPLNSERIENIKALSAETDPRLRGNAPAPNLRVQTGRFAELIAKLRVAEKAYDRQDAALAKAQKQGGGKDAVRAALPEVEDAARSLPDHAVLSSTAGKVCLLGGETARARQWFDRAVAMDQGIFEPEYGLSLLALAAKDWQSAVDHSDRGLAMLPGNYLSLYVRGEGNAGLGRTAQAQADFRAVTKSAPPDSAQYKAAAAKLGVAPTK